jgi:hypothetical protein
METSTPPLADRVEAQTGVEATACSCESPDAAQSYVYAIGSLRAEFPSESLRKEFQQAAANLDTAVPDQDLVYTVLSQGQYLYIAREICWVLRIDGDVDSYICRPRTYVELDAFVQSIKPPFTAGERSYTVVIGPRGPLAGPEACNGQPLPIVVCNEIYYFTTLAFVEAIAKATKVDPALVRSTFEELLSLTDNAGNTDEDRALNYVLLRYPGVYTLATTMLDPGLPPLGASSLRGVTARLARVQGTRRIVDVIFQYEQRETGELTDWFTRVDVTGQFPFLVSKLSRYYPRPS